MIYSEKIDIWSAGIVLYMMLSGTQPFEDENVSKVIANITMAEINYNEDIWSEITPKA